MDTKDQGLTVGELTMAIGALIIAGLIWSSLNKKEESSQTMELRRENIVNVKAESCINQSETT